MDCKEFKNSYVGHSKMGSDEFFECFEHAQECRSCSDVMKAVDLQNSGVDISLYPCVHMAEYAVFECENHSDLIDCNDAIVVYDSQCDQYLINDPRPAQTIISNCPWCGVELPDKIDQWFKELQELGFDDPLNQDIPERYKSDAWYRNS